MEENKMGFIKLMREQETNKINISAFIDLWGQGKKNLLPIYKKI